MNDYLSTTEADWFVKLDNDIALPAGWLEPVAAVMGRRPKLELLGIDGGMTGVPDMPPELQFWDYEACSHIGGIGAMRVSAFHHRPPLMSRGRHGFTQWQEKHEPRRGWITPGIGSAELDKIPAEPWRTLAAEYVERGWAREWGEYSPLHPWWEPMLQQLKVAA